MNEQLFNWEDYRSGIIASAYDNSKYGDYMVRETEKKKAYKRNKDKIKQKAILRGRGVLEANQ